MSATGRKGLAIAALLAAGLLALGAWPYPRQALHAYMWAYQLVLGCSLGSLAVLMIHHLVGGGWGGLLRRPLEAAAGVLPWLAVGFVPVALGLPWLYAWAGPAPGELVREQAAYFNLPGFLARAAAYFAAWIGLAAWLQHASDEQTRTGDPAWRGRLAAASGPGLVLYAVTTFFAAVDWIMALEPGWFSTAIGLVYAAGQVELGFAVGILTLAALATRPPVGGLVKAQHLNDLGNLLLAATMTWAYLAYAQYLVIWSGNLRVDVAWYVHRSNGGWQAVIPALVVLHFALPFGLLLFRAAKRDVRWLAGIAAMLAAGQLVHLFWQVTPAVSPVLHASWLDLAAFVALGAAWTWAYAGRLAARPLPPPPGEPIEETPDHAY
jgi:hypothetical protein